MTKDSFIINQEKYQGPLEMVVSLLRKRQLHVSDVNLAQITDEFAAYINTSAEAMDELSDFVRVMSVLLLIKTKALLPKEVLGVDEEETIAQFEADLIRIETLNELVNLLTTKNSFFLSRREKPKSVPQGFIPDHNLNPEILYKFAAQISEEPLREETFAKVAVKKLANLKTTLESIERRLLTLGQAKLPDIIPDSMSSEEKVVHFIAVLELLKQNSLTLVETSEGDKVLQYGQVTTPHYGTK